MATRTIYIFRHSESTDNKHQIFSGWRDPKLTAKGIAQAKKIAQKLKRKDINIAFTSDLTRAIQTLNEVLKFHKNVPVIVDARLRERDYGRLTGTSKTAFEKKNPKLYRVYHRSYNVGPPKGESFKQVNARVAPFIKDLLHIVKEFKVNVAISAHGNSIRPLRKHFEHLTISEMRRIENPHDKYWAYRVTV
ncbi:MAG TPA: histidine phosphatase family protein [Candidatus Binatia bacterium]|nr:histidine phosphatase family protein [Candidatus Binatia bacterium]